jgi:hypothetical protein
VKTFNEVYSSLSVRRRYEVWFVRLGLADGGGAWWFRYLLMNPGRCGCADGPQGMPVQVWATWFPRDGTPQSFIQGFPLEGLDLSPRKQIHSTSKSARMESARTPAAEHWKLGDTRFRGTCIGVPRSASR